MKEGCEKRQTRKRYKQQKECFFELRLNALNKSQKHFLIFKEIFSYTSRYILTSANFFLCQVKYKISINIFRKTLALRDGMVVIRHRLFVSFLWNLVLCASFCCMNNNKVGITTWSFLNSPTAFILVHNRFKMVQDGF